MAKNEVLEAIVDRIRSNGITVSRSSQSSGGKISLVLTKVSTRNVANFSGQVYKVLSSKLGPRKFSTDYDADSNILSISYTPIKSAKPEVKSTTRAPGAGPTFSYRGPTN